MKKVTKLSTGFSILASGFLLNACENSASVDELNQQVEKMGELSTRVGIQLPFQCLQTKSDMLIFYNFYPTKL